MGDQKEKKGVKKWKKKTSWGDGYTHYIDCGDGFTAVYIYKNEQMEQFQ